MEELLQTLLQTLLSLEVLGVAEDLASLATLATAATAGLTAEQVEVEEQGLILLAILVLAATEQTALLL